MNATVVKKMDNNECFTYKNEIDQYVINHPSPEMAFIEAIIKKHVSGPVPEQLTNR